MWFKVFICFAVCCFIKLIVGSNFADLLHIPGFLGIEELKIVVVEPDWSHKQEMITSMNMKYMAVWDIVDE